MVRIGLFLEVAAITGLGLSISLAASGGVLASWLFLYGTGVGMATAQLTSVILIDVPVSQSGQASGLQSTVRQLGAALGIAVLGTLLVSTLGAATANNLSAVPGLPDSAQKQVVSVVQDSAGAAIPVLGKMPGGQPAQDAAESAMVTAARITTLSAAGIIFLGLLATIALPPMKPHADEDSVQAGVLHQAPCHEGLAAGPVRLGPRAASPPGHEQDGIPTVVERVKRAVDPAEADRLLDSVVEREPLQTRGHRVKDQQHTLDRAMVGRQPGAPARPARGMQLCGA